LFVRLRPHPHPVLSGHSSSARRVFRISEPSRGRLFQIPPNFNWRGKEIPIISLVGIVSCLSTFALVAALHEEGRNLAFGWFAVGFACFYASKRRERGAGLEKGKSR
jgi:hypothetical protein